MPGESTYKGPVRVEGVVQPGSPIGYSDFVAVQQNSYSVVISFFQMDFPVFETEPELAAFKQNPTVKAYCLGRIAVPREQAKRLQSLLEKQLGPAEQLPEGDR